MKCDELNYKMIRVEGKVIGVCLATEVDEAIAELKAENEKLNNALDKERSETIKYMDELCNAKNEIERLTIDKRNAELRADVADATVEKLKAENVQLKHKLQDQCISCPVKMQEDDVVAEKDNEIRRLKRELWLTRGAVHKAKRLAMYGLLQAYPLWEGSPAGLEVHKKIFRYDGYERKCRAKAEEYK